MFENHRKSFSSYNSNHTEKAKFDISPRLSDDITSGAVVSITGLEGVIQQTKQVRKPDLTKHKNTLSSCA